MAPVDPIQLLKALNPLLGPRGEIKGPTEAARIASLMKDAAKIVSRCIYINILKLVSPTDALEKFMSVGGWETLNDWLQDFKEEENYPALIELLKVYRQLPISVDILKQNNAAKTIKQLCKAENDTVKTLAATIFDEWMKKVKGNNNNNNESKKKKKKDKESETSEKSAEKDSEKSDKAKSKDSKHDQSHNNQKDAHNSHDTHHSKDSSSNSHHSNTSHSLHKSSNNSPDLGSTKSFHYKDKEKDSKSGDKNARKDLKLDKVPRRDSKAEKIGRVRRSSGSSDKGDEITSVRQGSGLKLHIKLGGDKEKDTTKSDTDRKRASTVKRPPSKFRSTGVYCRRKA